MVNYKDLGLVNTREMFKRAVSGGYAIPAFNFNTMEQMQAIVQAAVETKSPVIMQVSKGARTMLTVLSFATWQRALYSMLRNSAASIQRLFSTSTTEIHSSFARIASTMVSLQ